jgi:hypothetical protein
MNISPDEAKESLVVIQRMTQRTRRSIASSGAYIFLILTGIIWLVGFLSTQFLPGEITAYIWTGMSVLGAALSVFLGTRMGKRVRSSSVNISGKRAGIFWLLLVFYCIATIAIAHPTDGKQITLFIILFIMIGQLAMGLLLSFSSVWWALPITALALVGYFLFPNIFYLWMGFLVGGGMVFLGLYIRLRW